jgi:hypothetical protein
MTTLAEVIEWKYGSIAGTKQADPSETGPNPKMVISYWKHETEPEPNEEQLTIDFEEYEIFKAAEDEKKEARKNGLTAIKEKYKDKKKSDITNADAMEYIKFMMAGEYGI